MQPAFSPAPPSPAPKPAPAPAVGPRAAADPLLERLPGITALFVGYLCTIAIEYGGLGIQIPALGASKIPTLIAYGLFFAVLSKVGMTAFGGYRQMKILLALVIWTAASILWAVVRSIVPVLFPAPVPLPELPAKTPFASFPKSHGARRDGQK